MSSVAGLTIEERLERLEMRIPHRYEQTRLLEEARSKPVREFVQYDAFHTEGPDSLFGGWVNELRNGTPCRVQIEPGVDAASAVAMLRRIVDWIETDGLLEKPDPNEPIPF
jgi:hypothetical protein